MRHLLISCEKCRRVLRLEFEGEAQALGAIVAQRRVEHLAEDLCSGRLVAALLDVGFTLLTAGSQAHG